MTTPDEIARRLRDSIALPMTGKSGNELGAPEFEDATGDELHRPDVVAAIVAAVNAFPALADRVARLEGVVKLARDREAAVAAYEAAWKVYDDEEDYRNGEVAWQKLVAARGVRDAAAQRLAAALAGEGE